MTIDHGEFGQRSLAEESIVEPWQRAGRRVGSGVTAAVRLIA